jgi:hypothetical protein
MTHILSLGAINKITGEYVYPKMANKKDEYICPECNKELILCQGEIRVHYFRHKVDNVNPCHHYSNNPTEAQIHKDAKILLKNLLERKIPISFSRTCCCCKNNEEFEIPEISETSTIQLEYRFEYNGLKIADVAYIDDCDIICIFEICNTHKTCIENRPEPWFEINAEMLVKLANDNILTSLEIPCIRCEKCDDCIKLENLNLKYYNIEKYVRIKLGQKYPIPDYYEEDEFGERQVIHLRINVDARIDASPISHNKNIVELFEEDFINKKIVILSWKGSATAYIISKLSYEKYNYWGEKYGNMRFPYEKLIDISNESTISIIIKLIEYCRNANNIKQERLKKIKNDIINVNNRKEQWKKEIDINDDADTFRSMRYSKQDSNHKMSLTQELTFIENDINYILGNNIVTIEHPLTHTKLKRSLVNNKTFYKGKWRTDISIKLIINWYNSYYDILDEL